mgnify:CR=1 FL=1
MKTIEISYNPYKMVTHILIDKIDVCKNDSYEKFREFIQNKIPLQTWIEPIPYLDWAGFVNEISDPETDFLYIRINQTPARFANRLIGPKSGI